MFLTTHLRLVLITPPIKHNNTQTKKHTGWNVNEAEVLRKALMRFGIGNWSKIIESNCLVGKTNAQMNLQTQRMLGQQSTAEFAGLHIDPRVIGQKNSLVQGDHIRRKNGCIVNTGAKLSREEIRRRVAENKEL